MAGGLQRTGAINVLFFVSVLGAVRHNPLLPPRLFSGVPACTGFGISAAGRACSTAGREEPPRGVLPPAASSSASSRSAAPEEIVTLRGEILSVYLLCNSSVLGAAVRCDWFMFMIRPPECGMYLCVGCRKEEVGRVSTSCRHLGG